MKKYTLAAFFLVLGTTTIGVLVWLFSSSSGEKISLTPITKEKAVSKSTSKTTWVSKMAQVATKEYQYPVNELYIKLPLQMEKEQKKHTFQLSINNSDEYSYFCITQTLNSYSSPYTIIKDKEQNRIFINASSRKFLNELSKRLDEYSIKSSLNEAWL